LGRIPSLQSLLAVRTEGTSTEGEHSFSRGQKIVFLPQYLLREAAESVDKDPIVKLQCKSCGGDLKIQP